MATDVLAQMEAYAAALQAADIRATLDPRDINPPAVLIRPPTLHYRFGRGCVGADWTARLYLPDPGTVDALRTALPLLTAIQEVLNFADAVPGDFTLLDGATVPGYSMTWATH